MMRLAIASNLAERQITTNKTSRIGVFVLASDASIERDITQILPLSVTAHFTRMDNYETCGERSTDHVTDLARAAKLLAECEDISVLIYGCTSGEICFGYEQIAQTIQSVFPGKTVVTPLQAVAACAKENHLGTITILSPYGHDLNHRMIEIFAAAGISTEGVISPPSWQGRRLSSIGEYEFRAAIRGIQFAKSEALFIPCNALPVVDTIATIEACIGLPVLTSTQTSMWLAARSRNEIGAISPDRFGQIFSSKDRRAP